MTKLDTLIFVDKTVFFSKLNARDMAPPMRSSFTFPIEMKAAKNIDNKCLRIW